jgi:hypothetical protein
MRSQGYDLEGIALRVASLFEMDPEEIYAPGTRRRLVHGRCLYCCWAVRDLALSAIALAKRLYSSQPGGENSKGKSS